MLIIVNEDAFDLTPEQTNAIRNEDRLWRYFRDEARYAAESTDGKIAHEDIVCAVLNAGTIWKDEKGLFHLTDFDSNRFEYIWNGPDEEGPGRWVSVK